MPWQKPSSFIISRSKRVRSSRRWASRSLPCAGTSQALLQFRLNGGHGPAPGQVGGDVMAGGKDRDLCEFPQGRAPQRIDLPDGLHRVAPKLDADGPVLFVGRKDLHPVAPHPKGAPVEIDVVALVQNFHQLGSGPPGGPSPCPLPGRGACRDRPPASPGRRCRTPRPR